MQKFAVRDVVSSAVDRWYMSLGAEAEPCAERWREMFYPLCLWGILRMPYVDHAMITRQKFHIVYGSQVCVANSTAFRTLNGHLHKAKRSVCERNEPHRVFIKQR
jgi:hypothetical protein